MLLDGFPDRVARRALPGADEFLVVGGRRAALAVESVVRTDDLLLALDISAGRRGAHARDLIRCASRLERSWLEAHPAFGGRDELRWDAARERVTAWRVARFADLTLDEAPIPLTDRAGAEQLLLAQAARDPARAVKPDEAARALIERLQSLARWAPELGLPVAAAEMLAASLPGLVRGRSSFEELRRVDLRAELLAALDWRARGALDQVVPERIAVPSGRRVRLRYQPEGPPILAVKVQELFGLDETPRVGERRRPALLHLQDPAGRPLQVTADLSSFWRRTWPEVRKEMRARYPKHRWPEDPLAAAPSVRTTKPRKGS